MQELIHLFEIKSTDYGFSIKYDKRRLTSLSHLLYMDDFKYLALTRNLLEQMLRIVDVISNDIGIQLDWIDGVT